MSLTGSCFSSESAPRPLYGAFVIKPDGGQTPFAQSKGTVLEGGFREPAMIRWPGHVPAGKVENGSISGLDWFPTFLAAAGDPNIIDVRMSGQTCDWSRPPYRLLNPTKTGEFLGPKR
jgi:arylsulfatase A-like enzyme